MKNQYINAVAELLLQGKDADTVLSNLLKVLKEKGHTSIYADILKGVAAKLELYTQNGETTVVVASQEDVKKHSKAIERSLEAIEGSLKTASIEIDQTLIGGFVAIHKGKSIDMSYKQKLVSLYRSITK